MFNFSGSEIVFLLLLALIILGPEKLPEAIRKFGSTYAEFKKVTTGFQTELKQALDEPVREMRETAEMLKQAATFDVVNPVTEIQSEVKKAAIGTFPAGTPTTATPAGTPPASSSEPASDAASDAASDVTASGVSDHPDAPSAATHGDARVSLDPTDPSGAAPPRVSQIAQANASANQPFARAAAAAATAAAAETEAAAATDPVATTTQAVAAPSQYVQRMRTLDEVFGGRSGHAGTADAGTTDAGTTDAGTTDAPATGLADQPQPAADGDGPRPA